jgi:RES domain-containing protein
VIFYRIARARFDRAATAFSGDAAAKVAHRWNHPSQDIRAVYCSDSLALACLECIVHLRPLPRVFPASVYYTVNIPDDMLEVAARSTLPSGWDSAVAGNASRDYGTAFLREHRAPGLAVPTVIQPLGLNIVLNPLHRSFNLEWIHGPLSYEYDGRLE